MGAPIKVIPTIIVILALPLLALLRVQPLLLILKKAVRSSAGSYP